ncbi:UDP-N-acetylmuramate dehydrogenase [Candidatus Nomurabacteria bacterium]|nr:UDP-N-acetylmuramate dehydrogenase [Candidatus Nomurabacteria bacterium]
MYTELKKFGKVKTDEPLSKHTTFKIGGPAKYFVVLEDVDVLVELLQYLDGEGMPYFLLGGGSNMLASDSGFDGVVIQIKDKTIHIDKNTVEAAAGAITVEVAQQSMKAGLTGFEWGVGVPGTIGGAVRGNAGAMGKEMKDDVLKVLVYKDGEVLEVNNEACGFAYRSSLFKREGGIVLKVFLSLEIGEENLDAKKKMLEFLKYRNTTQPQGFASTGCIFKNAELDQSTELGKTNKEKLFAHFDEHDEKIQQFLKVGKISAGWLVEQVGLKGYTVGQAQISQRHGNFIVNLGGAKAADVLSIIETIQDRVYNEYGIEMEEEIQIVGDN